MTATRPMTTTATHHAAHLQASTAAGVAGGEAGVAAVGVAAGVTTAPGDGPATVTTMRREIISMMPTSSTAISSMASTTTEVVSQTDGAVMVEAGAGSTTTVQPHTVPESPVVPTSTLEVRKTTTAAPLITASRDSPKC